MAAVATFSVPAFSDDWDTCSSNVESWMWAQGMCGASNCFDDSTSKDLNETVVAKCGWPTFSEQERRQLVDQAVEDCHIADLGGLDCSMATLRLMKLFKPTDPIHGRILDGVFAKH
jgi:hypothetical protein